jgi:hypothetical protein
MSRYIHYRNGESLYKPVVKPESAASSPRDGKSTGRACSRAYSAKYPMGGG